MQHWTRSRYAVMALVQLARHGMQERRAASLAEIAAVQQPGLRYLEQLLARLRRANLVVSMRGPGGDDRLAQAAEAVTIADIVKAVDERLRVTPCGENTPPCLALDIRQVCDTHALWHELGPQSQFFLAGIPVAKVVRGIVAGRAHPVPPSCQAAE